MNEIRHFDALIVYTETLASSAFGVESKNHTPFVFGSRNESYNTVYGYFLKTCRKHGLNVAFTTSADIIGPGYCRSYWNFRNNKWERHSSPCFSKLIFDKFSPTRGRIRSRRDLLFSSEEIKSFNDPELFGIFFDKQKTYDTLSEHSIPTISLDSKTLQGVNEACKTLAQLMGSHPGLNDFSEDIVMKDRFGAGGRHIYKFKTGQAEKMLKVLQKNSRISFVIQPFAKFDQGFSYRNCPASTDIRLIYLDGKIAQSYIRMAKTGDFRCNEHQGGSLTYLTLEELPKNLLVKSNLISEMLNKKDSLFALDFIISNSGNSYLLEGNTGPGLDWNMSLRKNELEAKKLIRMVVKELTTRSESQFVIN